MLRCSALFLTRVHFSPELCALQNRKLCLNSMKSTRKEFHFDFWMSREPDVLGHKQLQISRGSHNLSEGEKTRPEKKEKALNEVVEQKKLKKPLHRFSLENHRFRNFIIFFALAYIYYHINSVHDPISGRRKFHLFSKRQILTLGAIQSSYYKKKYKKNLETSGNFHRRVSNVLNTLLDKNSHLPGVAEGRTWTVYVALGGAGMESYATANGDIFVNSALLEAVDDDQLAAMLAHLVAHVLLDHSAETPSLKLLVSSLLLKLLLIVYSIPLVGYLVHPLVKRMSVSALNRQPGPKLEGEADSLSMDLVAKSCYDPRQVKVFWQTMEALGVKKARLLKSHPISNERYDRLDSLMPKAFITLHNNCFGNLHPYLGRKSY